MSEQSYSGGCHCGAVRFETTLDVAKGITCNCSRCSKLNWIVGFTPAAQFKLLQGEDSLTEYQFGKKSISHLFCKTCGIESFARGAMEDGSKIAAVSVNCLDDVDISKLEPHQYDGASA